MEMILGNVSALSSDPKAWVVAALVSLKALHSIFLYFRCPVARGVAAISEEMIANGKSFKFQPPISFLLIMTSGMALATAGLFIMSDTSYGPLALGAVVIGTFMFLTEPTRLGVNNSKMAVFGSTGAPGDANELARDRLKTAYRERATYELIIAAVVVMVLFYL